MSCLRTTTQWRRWGSNPRPLGLESRTLPMNHCTPNSIRHVFFENQREKQLDRCPSIRHANLNCETLVGKTIAALPMQDTCLLASETPLLCRCSCNKYVFWSSVTSTNTTAVQTCLLVKWCARWVLAGLLPLNQYACRSFTTQSVCLPSFYHSISMPADLLPLIPACLLVLCISICNTCVNGVSL